MLLKGLLNRSKREFGTKVDIIVILVYAFLREFVQKELDTYYAEDIIT